MTEINVAQTLILGHLWQSVAIAAVLAAVLIFGRRMRGATRYSLAGLAFIASLALPLAAFVPGETLVTAVLDKLDAPEATPVEPDQTQTEPTVLQTVAQESGVPAWLLEAGARALASSDGAPASETPLGRTAVEDGAPAWAIDIGGEILRAAVGPAPAPPPPAKTEPMFTLPEFALPQLNLPDLTLPLALVWLAGTLILLVRIGRDLMAVERLVAHARPADLPEKLRRRMKGVRVAVSADAPGPMAAGLFRPCIVLPENIALNSPGMAALLEHEKAHIQRCDMMIALAQRIVLALLWWSPALYWISRRIDEEREVACDEAAVHCTGDAKAFARSLTIEAQNHLWARAPRLAVGAIGPRSQVGRRIRRLIDLAKGISPAKYSGRLAFAGLALAVAIAAMVTPRFPADAQQSSLPPVDDSLAGESVDLLSPQSRDRIRAQADAGGLEGGRVSYDSDAEDFAALGEEIGALMETVGAELEVALSGLSPELEAELHGLSAEMAALGAEISVAVSQEVLNEMPQIMEEVRRSLEAEGIEVGDWQDFRGLSEEERDELREKLQEARDEIREQLGPEMREEIREAIEEARAELAEHREEIRAAIQQSHSGMAIARAAMAEARAEIERARVRGDFDRMKRMKFDFDRDFDFDVDQEVIQRLREKGIDFPSGAIRIKADDDTPDARLMRAARRCNEPEVRRLITDEKANVNAVFQGDGTPLIEAARAGCVPAVRALLNADADPNLMSPGDGNPLIAAAYRNHDDVARLLIDRGASVNGPAPGDGNPLIAAAQRGHLEMVEMLTGRGANVNSYVEGDETPLMAAAERGKLDVVKFLVDRGANVNLAYNVETWRGSGRTMELRSPLNMAERHGNDEVAAYLRSKGAVANPKAAN
jgi:beta-lactamase regulating signal transducer with metallopeptidase domain